MDTTAQQTKLAVAAIKKMPMQQQQPQIPKPQQQPTTTITKTAAKPDATDITIAAPAATIPQIKNGTAVPPQGLKPKRILRAPMQILINLKKKRQETAAIRTAYADDDTSDDDDLIDAVCDQTTARAIAITARTSAVTTTTTTDDETTKETNDGTKKSKVVDQIRKRAESTDFDEEITTVRTEISREDD